MKSFNQVSAVLVYKMDIVLLAWAYTWIQVNSRLLLSGGSVWIHQEVPSVHFVLKSLLTPLATCK